MIGEDQITLLGLLYSVSSRTQQDLCTSAPSQKLLLGLLDFLSAWIPMISAHLSHCLPCRNLAPLVFFDAAAAKTLGRFDFSP